MIKQYMSIWNREEIDKLFDGSEDHITTLDEAFVAIERIEEKLDKLLNLFINKDK